jgi:molecular chaperone GrpE (heat shock protein)
MGLGRFIKHVLAPGTATMDLVKNMVDEGSVVEGCKKSIKQEFTEDNPLTSSVYKYGKYDGKKEGYEEASDEYEKKLLEQADEFLKQKKNYEKERGEYEALLDAYEQEIEEIENKVDRTQAENELLQRLLIREHGLMKLARG